MWHIWYLLPFSGNNWNYNQFLRMHETEEIKLVFTLYCLAGHIRMPSGPYMAYGP